MTGLDNNLSAQQRMQRQQELHGTFNNDFSKSMDGVVTDPAARQRYDQMNWQYRGYGAFNDPAIQRKLNLTAEQRQKFGNYENDWIKQMTTWNRDYSTDREGVTSRFKTARRESQDRVNSTLTAQQQQTWGDMSGKPYDFPAEVYFQNSTSSNTTLKPVLK